MRLQQIRQGTQARVQHDIPTHDPLHAIEEPLELAKDRWRPLVSLARVRRRIRKAREVWRHGVRYRDADGLVPVLAVPEAPVPNGPRAGYGVGNVEDVRKPSR